MPRPLTSSDIPAWLALAREVEPLFGPMADVEEFQIGIRDCVDARSAFGVEDASGELAGIVALNRGDNEIAWLAVARAHRGKRYGERLVDRAIEELEPHGDIYVQTFADGIEAGEGARRIYRKKGFKDLKDAGGNPAGIETVIMVRKSE
jgi:GNAT superfamily N-acetyltransferase